MAVVVVSMGKEWILTAEYDETDETLTLEHYHVKDGLFGQLILDKVEMKALHRFLSELLKERDGREY